MFLVVQNQILTTANSACRRFLDYTLKLLTASEMFYTAEKPEMCLCVCMCV